MMHARKKHGKVMNRSAGRGRGIMKKEDSIWQCDCGTRVRISAGEKKPEKVICPQCGAEIASKSKVLTEESAGDTQMVNIAEMARMAQEGLDVAASGEWETQPEKRLTSRRDPED